MDDQNVFERQLGDEILRVVGPPQPFDDLAVFEAVASDSSVRPTFRSMFGATKVMVAGAIVALFGGFVLAGMLTQPSEEQPPAIGASASVPAAETTPEEPSRTSADLLPGVELVTEEVEPGLYRVLSDGVRELSRPMPGYPYAPSWMTLTAGLDGSVWLFPGRQWKPQDAQWAVPGHELPFRLGSEIDERLGQEREGPDGEDFPALRGFGRMVGPSGKLWSAGDGLWSFDSDRDEDPWWQFRDIGYSYALGPDGSLWSVEETFDSTLLGRTQDGEAWSSWPVPLVDGGEILGITDDGEAWLVGSGQLARFDSTGWDVSRIPRGPWSSADVGPNGTLWAIAENEPFLIRFGGATGDAWTTFDASDGVPQLGGYEMPADLEVAPDGSVWINPIPPEGDPEAVCGGVHRFDGTVWQHYLEGICVYDLDISPDGTVWLRAGTFDLDADEFGSVAGPVELYAIDP